MTFNAPRKEPHPEVANLVRYYYGQFYEDLDVRKLSEHISSIPNFNEMDSIDKSVIDCAKLLSDYAINGKSAFTLKEKDVIESGNLYLLRHYMKLAYRKAQEAPSNFLFWNKFAKDVLASSDESLKSAVATSIIWSAGAGNIFNLEPDIVDGFYLFLDKCPESRPQSNLYVEFKSCRINVLKLTRMEWEAVSKVLSNALEMDIDSPSRFCERASISDFEIVFLNSIYPIVEIDFKGIPIASFDLDEPCERKELSSVVSTINVRALTPLNSSNGLTRIDKFYNDLIETLPNSD
ncbi:hypothetical protein RYA05_00840 [Pseudomonas syringae pv. actinidiae]|nr:hypothetical protein [Pseudomonas syringae pv. actinidiae]